MSHSKPSPSGTHWGSLVLLGLICCTPPQTGGDAASPQTTALLHNLASTIIAPAYVTFADEAATLNDALHELAATPTDEAAKIDAQHGWKTTMEAWQNIEVLQVGPAGSSLKTTGGANLRDEIYSWPTVSNCRVDQEIVKNEFTNADFFTSRLISSYGLDALEYLLFNPSLENKCGSLSTINTDGDCDALNETEIHSRRADYAKALGDNILLHAQNLETSWTNDDGEFFTQFTQAGTSSSLYEHSAGALNDLYAALFYVDLSVKDDKLGIPIGLFTCEETTCPDEVESLWAEHSTENIIANLQSFQTAFRGSASPDDDAMGFDDLLAQKGAESVSDTIQRGIDDAIQSLQSVNTSLKSALESDLATIQDAYASLKTAMDEFKTEFADVLELEVPQEGAGDND